MPLESQTTLPTPSVEPKRAGSRLILARVRLAAAAMLFVAWLGYLGYLALGHSKPVIVSHSQLSVAPVRIKAEIAVDASGKPLEEVHVLESFGGNPPKAETIKVIDLSKAHLPGGKPLKAAGAYFLLLKPIDLGMAEPGEMQYRLVAAPTGQGVDAQPLLLVYPWTAEVERQVKELTRNAKH